MFSVPPRSDRPAIQYNDTDVTTNTAVMTLQNTFSMLYGDIVAYSVIVTTSAYTQNPADSLVSSWAGSRTQNLKSPYFAVYRCADLLFQAAY